MGSLEHSNKDTLNLFKDLDIGKYEGHLNPPNYTSPLVYSAHVHAQDRRQTSDVPAIREGDHASKSSLLTQGNNEHSLAQAKTSKWHS